ncbi:glycosyltransferase family 1 protein, partial [bacterium]
IQRFAAEKGLHYDLLHSHYWMSGIAAIQLKAEWNLPILHMFHTLVLMKNRVARSPQEVEGGYRIDGEHQILRAADRIIAATPAELAQLEFLYRADKSKITVIPPGVDTSHFYPIPPDEARAAIGIQPHERMILFVGRIEPLKGIETLIRAIALLYKQRIISGCPHYLAIVGGDPSLTPEMENSEMGRLQALCHELGVDDLVVFLGKRAQDTLPYYYSAAEVVVMPSHYESFGMVALEAMACGTPVIASQVGGLAFLIQDGVTGYSIPDDNPPALAEKLSQLVCNPDLRNRLGSQAAEYARGYDWGIIAQRMADVYHELLAVHA